MNSAICRLWLSSKTTPSHRRHVFWTLLSLGLLLNCVKAAGRLPVTLPLSKLRQAGVPAITERPRLCPQPQGGITVDFFHKH